MKAKDAATALMDEDMIAPKERKKALKELYASEFKKRLQLRFRRVSGIEVKNVIPLWKEMTYWVNLVMNKTGVKIGMQELDDIFKASILKDNNHKEKSNAK